MAGAITGEASGHRPWRLDRCGDRCRGWRLVGNAEDAKEEKDAAVAHAQYEQARTQAIANAVTEADVVT